MSASMNVRAITGSRNRVKYVEQPFPQAKVKTKLEVNQQLESVLFKVPRELCNKIYEMVYQNTVLAIDVAAMFYCDGADSPHSAALILTCHRVFDECKSVFDRASMVYWQKDFIINIYQHPRIWRSLDWLSDEFLAHIRKFRVVVSLRDMPVPLKLRAKTDDLWHMDTIRQPDSGDDKLPSFELDPMARLKELQDPKNANKALQRGKSHDVAFKALTDEGLRLLLSMDA